MNDDGGQQTVHMIIENGGEATFMQVDVTSASAVEALISKSLFEKYQAASRLSIKRVIATYTNVSLVLGNSS
jgi:hypothetical protein